MSDYHLAQFNIAVPREPLESDLLRGFVAQLDPLNARADGAPGFVWRLQTEEGNATAVRVFDDDRLIVNMSVWTSLEALRDFVYGDPEHLAIMRRRREWFSKLDAFQVLWWVRAGHLPTVAEGEERLTLLRAVGPTPDAFTFRSPFPPEPGSDTPAEATDDDRWLCPSG